MDPLRVVVSGPIAGRVEVPATGSTVRAGRVRVSGWILPGGRPPARAEVQVDGRDAGLARVMAASWPNVGGNHESVAAPLPGFEHVVSIEAGQSDGVARINVDVGDLDGVRVSLTPVDVVVAPGPAIELSDGVTTGALVSQHSPVSRWPLRLIVFTHRLDFGGGQLYLQDLLRQLLRDPDLSCVVVSEHDGPLRDELEALGAHVYVTDYPVRSVTDYERRLGRRGRHGAATRVVRQRVPTLARPALASRDVHRAARRATVEG